MSQRVEMTGTTDVVRSPGQFVCTNHALPLVEVEQYSMDAHGDPGPPKLGIRLALGGWK